MEYGEIVDAATTVHKTLGSGWSESVYHSALEVELSKRGIGFSSEGTIPVMYDGVPVGRRRPDMFIDTDDGVIIIELKAGSTKGEAQLAQYRHLVDIDSNFEELRGGLLIRFNEDVEHVWEKIDD